MVGRRGWGDGVSASATWRRRAARRLVQHAGRILRPTRPEWSDALSSELDHIPDDHHALLWAAGCVRASYKDRYFGHVRSLLAAAAIGVAYELLDDTISGILAAQPWPRWYSAFARVHKHLSLSCGRFLQASYPVHSLRQVWGRYWDVWRRGASLALPGLSLGVWFVCSLGAEVYGFATVCDYPMLTLWESWTRSPALSVAGVILPAGAMLLTFRRTQIQRAVA